MPFTPETEIEFGSLHDKKIIGSPHRPVRNRCNRGGLDLSVRAHRFRSLRCAVLTVSETQNEAKDLGEPLRLVTLDTCKAFDVVWQESLLRQIFNVGVQGSQWVSMKNLYRGAISAVKW